MRMCECMYVCVSEYIYIYVYMYAYVCAFNADQNDTAHRINSILCMIDCLDLLQIL